jgi:hypothetical protein
MVRSDSAELLRYINLKLVALGQPSSHSTTDPYFLEIAGPLLRNYYQKDQLLATGCAPPTPHSAVFGCVLKDVCPGGAPHLPSNSFVLDRPGLARVMSLPPGADSFTSPYLHSYRTCKESCTIRKATGAPPKGIFHIVEGGLPIPADKLAVPKPAFANSGRGVAARRRKHFGSAVHRRSGRSGPLIRVAAAAAAGVPGHRDGSGQEHGDSLLRAGQPGEQSGFRGDDFRQRRGPLSARKTMPRSTCCTGPGTRAA